MPHSSGPGAAQRPSTALAEIRRERDLYAAGLGELSIRYEQKIQELSLLRRMSDVLRDCTELDEVFRRLLAIVQEELSVAACSVYLADETGDLVLRARCQADGAVEIVPPGHPAASRVPAGAGPLGTTFATGQVLDGVSPAAGSPGWFPFEDSIVFTAPLGPEGGCLGVLALHEPHRDRVGEDVTRLLPILATQATIAIENAALYRRLKRYSETLEIRVRERTAALEHLNAELHAAARQRAQFLAHFSHELRTPLNSILGFTELLRDGISGPLNDRQRRYASHVHESGTRLLRLINDILDLAKVDAGKLSLHFQAVEVPAAIEQALAAMQPQAQAKHLRMVQTTPKDLPAVCADPARVHQILLNLLSNAIKFTPEGGAVSVTARVLAAGGGPASDVARMAASSPDGREAARPAGALVEIAVHDTGIGIAVGDQARLFRDFEQTDAAQHQGTGLGLSLTRRLVGLLGGQIGLESAPGAGSRFWFALPVAVPAGERNASDGETAPRVAAPRVDERAS
jgi:signal transduction histidine kinase